MATFVDINIFDEPQFEETKHPRDRGGKFAKGASKAYSAVQKGVHTLKHHTDPDVDILKQQFHRANSAPRRKLSEHVANIAKTLPRLLKSHLKEEQHKAVAAAKALRHISQGHKPTPEEFKALRSFGLRILMSAGSMALSGDATGTVAHLAAKLGEEIVHHVVTEHAAQLAGSVGRFATTGALAGILRHRTADADDLDEHDIKLLRDFINALAKGAKEHQIPDDKAKQLLRKKSVS